MNTNFEDNPKEAKPGQYLTFTIAKECYGIPIGTVREINQLTTITPLPQAASFMEGVMNLRGKLIPIMNLRVKLGLPKIEYTKQTCVIVIDISTGAMGMIVDAVNEVIELTSAQIEESPLTDEEKENSFNIGMGKFKDQIIILLKITEMLERKEIKGIE